MSCLSGRNCLHSVPIASRTGDPRLRLERYLTRYASISAKYVAREMLMSCFSRQLEREDRLPEAIAVWQKATKRHKKSASIWAAYAEAES
jgi:hypothetical protein